MQPERTQVSASTPNAARVYDYLNGGKDNFEADRQLAEKLEAETGDGAGVRELAKVNRKFVLSAARWSASMLGISQFLDLGCGLPLKPSVHDTVRQGCPEATVVYADIDPVVISHAAALMAGPGLAAVQADAADPVTALLDAGGTGLLDLARPACLIFGGTLSTMDAEAARSAVQGYAKALAPGSAVIISCVSYADPGLGQRMASLYSTAGRWVNHDRETVASFFAAGLRLVHGCVMDVSDWPLLPEKGRDAAVLGGVGVKP